MNKTLFRLACALLALAVINGAFGAHMLKALLDPAKLQGWQTAVLYQFIHALGLLFIATNSNSEAFHAKRMRIAGYLLLWGIVLFSGSLYVLTTQEILGIHVSFLGPVTPIGGLLFIAGWIVGAFAVKKSAQSSN